MTENELRKFKLWLKANFNKIAWLAIVLVIGALASGGVADSEGARHCTPRDAVMRYENAPGRVLPPIETEVKPEVNCALFQNGFSMPYFWHGMWIAAGIAFAPFYLVLLNGGIVLARTTAGLTREERVRRDNERRKREREQREELARAEARIIELEADALSHPELDGQLAGLS